MPTSTDTKAQGKQKARKTLDCYPEKSEYRSKTAGKLCLEYVEKKLALLGQKKEKMDLHKEKLEKGEKLDQTALDSLDKYDKISHDHYVTEGIYKRLVDITDKHKKTMEDMNKKESDRIEEILKLQYTLDQFGAEEVREDFLKGKRGAVLLTQDNLDQLDALYQAISPMRSGGDKQEKGKPFDPSKLYAAASEHLVKYLDGDDGVVVGSTYKNLRKLVAQINKCGYFKRLQRIQFLEAAKEGGKRSKKTRKTKDGESEEREAHPATDQSSDKSSEHTDKIAQPSEEHKSQTVNTTEQDAFFAPSSSPYQQPSSTGSASASFSSQSAISSSTDVNNTASSSTPDIQSFTHNRPFQFIQTSYVMPDSSSPSVFDPAVIVAQPAGAYGLQFMSPLYDTNTTGVAATNNSSPAVGQQQQQQQQTQHHRQSPSQQQHHQQQQQQHHQHHPHHHQQQHQQQPPQPTQPQQQQQHHHQHPHQAMPAPGMAGLSSQQAQPQSGPTMAPSAPSVNALGMPVDLSQGPVDLSQSSMVKQQPQQHQQQPQHQHHHHQQQQQDFNVQSSFPQSEPLFPSTPSGSHTNEMSSTKLPGGPNTHSESRGSNSTSTSLPSMNNYDIPPSIPMPPSQQEPGQEPQEKKSPMNANAPVFQSMYAAAQASGGSSHHQQQQQQQQQGGGGNMSSRHQTPPSSSDIPPVPHATQSATSDYNMPSNTFGGPSGDFVTNDFQSGYQGSNGFSNGNYGRGGLGGGNRGGYRGPRGGSAGTGGPANNMNSRNGGGSYQNYGPGPNTGYRSDNFQSGGYGSSSFGNANSYVKRGGMNSGMGGPGNPGYPPRPAGMGPNPNRGAMRGGMPRGGPRGGPHRAGFGRPQ